jgi:hypothetical protein
MIRQAAKMLIVTDSIVGMLRETNMVTWWVDGHSRTYYCCYSHNNHYTHKHLSCSAHLFECSTVLLHDIYFVVSLNFLQILQYVTQYEVKYGNSHGIQFT